MQIPPNQTFPLLALPPILSLYFYYPSFQSAIGSLREVELQRILKFFLLNFLNILSIFSLSLFLHDCLRQFFLQFLTFCVLSLHYLAPVSIDTLGYPGLSFHSGHSLHAEYFQSDAVSAHGGVGDSFDALVVLTLGVLDHGVDGGKLFGAFGAAEVFGLLMVVEDDFVLETLLTVETEGAEACHVPTLAAHLLLQYTQTSHNSSNGLNIGETI